MTICISAFENIIEKEYIDLVMIINQVNKWNRLSIAMGRMGIHPVAK